MTDYRKYLAFAGFLSTIPLANWLISNVGTYCVPDGPCVIPLGFGLEAPTGVLLIGLALVLRDALQELTNWKWSFAAIVIGSILSALLANPFIAIASATAFLVSETLDMSVYSKIKKNSLSLAVLVSGIVGAAVDSAIFLYLAFGNLDFLLGNAVGKIYASVVAAGFLRWYKR